MLLMFPWGKYLVAVSNKGFLCENSWIFISFICSLKKEKSCSMSVARFSDFSRRFSQGSQLRRLLLVFQIHFLLFSWHPDSFCHSHCLSSPGKLLSMFVFLLWWERICLLQLSHCLDRTIFTRPLLPLVQILISCFTFSFSSLLKIFMPLIALMLSLVWLKVVFVLLFL